MPLGQGILVVLRESNTWLLGSYAFLLFGTMTMMQGLWAVPYLMDAYGQTQQQAANALTLWAVGLIVGCTLWGYLADKIMGSRKRVVLAGAVVYALLWVLLAILPIGLPDGLLWVAMFWGGFFASTWIPAYAQLKDSVPPRSCRNRHGDSQPLLLARGRCVSASQRTDCVGVCPAERTHTRRGVSGGVLVVPGFRGNQYHPSKEPRPAPPTT